MDRETMQELGREAAGRAAGIGAELSETAAEFPPSRFAEAGRGDLARAVEAAVEAHGLAERGARALASGDTGAADDLFSEAWVLCYDVAEDPLFEEGMRASEGRSDDEACVAAHRWFCVAHDVRDLASDARDWIGMA